MGHIFYKDTLPDERLPKEFVENTGLEGKALRYVSELWPVEQLAHKAKRLNEGENGEFFPRTVDTAVICSIKEAVMVFGKPAKYRVNEEGVKEVVIWCQLDDEGNPLVDPSTGDIVENADYNSPDLQQLETNSLGTLNQVINGLEERMTYVETSGVGVNTVGTPQLQERAVTGEKLDLESVESKHIKNGTIEFIDINPTTVIDLGNALVGGDTVGLVNDKLEVIDGSINSEKFADDAFNLYYKEDANALQDKVVKKTFGAVKNDSEATIDKVGIKLEERAGTYTKYDGSWLINDTTADPTGICNGSNQSVSEVFDHIINTDVVMNEIELSSDYVILPEVEGEQRELVDVVEVANPNAVTSNATAVAINAAKDAVKQDHDADMAIVNQKIADVDAKIVINDVKLNGTSVLSGKVANIDLATDYYKKPEVNSQIDQKIDAAKIKTADGEYKFTNGVATLPTASATVLGVVKINPSQIDSTATDNDVPTSRAAYTALNKKANVEEVYNKADSDAKFMDKSTQFKTVGGVSIFGTGDIPVGDADTVKDVQINGTSIVDADMAANIPYAGIDAAGVVFTTDDYISNKESKYIVPSCLSVMRLDDRVDNVAKEIAFEGTEDNVVCHVTKEDGTIVDTLFPNATTEIAGATQLLDEVDKTIDAQAVTPRAVWYYAVNDVVEKVFEPFYWSTLVIGSADHPRSASKSYGSQEVQAPTKVVVTFDNTNRANPSTSLNVSVNSAVIGDVTSDQDGIVTKEFILDNVAAVTSVTVASAFNRDPFTTPTEIKVEYCKVYEKSIVDDNRIAHVEVTDVIDEDSPLPVSARAVYGNNLFIKDEATNSFRPTSKGNVLVTSENEANATEISGTSHSIVFGNEKSVLVGSRNVLSMGGSVNGSTEVIAFNGSSTSSNHVVVTNGSSATRATFSTAMNESSVTDSDYAFAHYGDITDSYNGVAINGYLNGASESVVIGTGSSVKYANDSAIIGNYNDIEGDEHNYIFGNSNTIKSGDEVFVLGCNNTIEDYNDANPLVVLGKNVKLPSGTGLVKDTAILAVGTGTADPSSAMYMTQDGRLFLKNVGGYDGINFSGLDVATVIKQLAQSIGEYDARLREQEELIEMLQLNVEDLQTRVEVLERKI